MTSTSTSPTAERGSARRALIDGVHLAVLWGFAVVQPVLDVIHADAEFFVDREVGGVSFALAVLAFAFGPPLLMLAIELVAGRFDERARTALHLVFVWALAALVVLYPLAKRTPDEGWSLVMASLFVGAIATLAYWRFEPLRHLATVLAPAPVLFVVVFLFFTPARDVVFPGEVELAAAPAAPAPVVMVVLDELPLTSLLGPDGRVDAARYPSFARLARDGSWYRHTTASADSTLRAVPAIMTGRVKPDAPATLRAHPRNVFTLFGRSHRVNAVESEVRLCPESLCPQDPTQLERTGELPSALSAAFARIVMPRGLRLDAPPPPLTWAELDRLRDPAAKVPRDASRGELGKRSDVQFGHWLRRIRRLRAGERPPLHFIHMLLPHAAWKFVPSGKLYAGSYTERVARFQNGTVWVNEPGLVYRHWLQRHLLQCQYADRLLGRLIRRLERAGLYDQSAVAVVADHGSHFAPGRSQREVVRESAADIGSVPFFVKAPRQEAGGTVDAQLQTVDVLPTLAGAAGARWPWRTEGRPASELGSGGRKRLGIQRKGGTLTVTPGLLERQRRATVARQARLFGSGDRGPGLVGAGPHRELIGRRVADLRRAEAGAQRLALDRAGDLTSVDPRSSHLPALVTGRLAPAVPGRDLALALNGRVVTTARAYGRGRRLAVLLPPRSIRPGRNRLRAYLIHGSGGRARLQPIGGTR